MFKPVENVYYIKQQSFNTMDECYKEYLNQKESLKRVQKKHPTVSIVTSCGDVDGNLAVKYNVREGQVGHPVYEFKGILGSESKVPYKKRPHIHTYFVGPYAATASKEFSLMMCKRFYKNHPDTKVRKMPFFSSPTGDGMFSEKYLTNQARHISYIGNKDQLKKFDRDINPPKNGSTKPNERWIKNKIKKEQYLKRTQKITDF